MDRAISISNRLSNSVAGGDEKKKKAKHVKIIPSSVKMDLAIQELQDTKRNQTIGQKWNSAYIFSVMWSLYIVGITIYFLTDRVYCLRWLIYYLLRFLLLIPTFYIGRLWETKRWPSWCAEPEWVGVYIATYIALISTLSFCVGLNESCGRRESVAKDTVLVKLTNDDYLYKLNNGRCSIHSGVDYGTYEGTCSSELLDRGTFFEKHVFNWVGQLILYLFAFTSLFKPSLYATIVYTGNVGVIGFLGCWYQGFQFWDDSDRVVASGIGTAIFLFLSAAAVNIFSAHVLHNMERDLVRANCELTANMEKRQKQPSGPNVVYLETDLQSSTKLWEHHTETMHKAIKVHHNLMRSLALEYFGWELATEGDAFLLAFHDVFDAVSFALTFQYELMEEEWAPELLEDVDCLLEHVKVGADEREVMERLKKGHATLRKRSVDGGGTDLLAFQGLRVRMAIHMGSSEGGIKGPSCRFVHHLTDLSWGGMILLSEPVSKALAGVLDQLGNSASSLKESVNIPRMVSMGIHTFEDYHDPQEMFHIFNEPLRGRHMMWDQKSLKLRDSTQHALGFYDAPVSREGVNEDACIVFGDVENGAAIQKFNNVVFSESILSIHATMGPILNKCKGYNVPQREGHFMFVFHDVLSAACFHRELQSALLKVQWSPTLKDFSATAPVNSDSGAKGLLFNGLTISLGLSHGPVSKQLEAGRANYSGPTANRAARVSSMSRAGQLTMFEEEYKKHGKTFANADPIPITAKILLKEVELKGVTGKPNVVILNTDELTTQRQGVISGLGDRVSIGSGI
jgi:class 3 adenylate cyclase